MLEHTVEYATDLLKETGEAYPFGAFLDTIGNVHPLEMEIDPKKVPQNGKVIESLRAYCETEMLEERVTGYALAFEVQLQLEEGAAPIDAISIEMKHIADKAIPHFYLPFETLPDKSVQINELFGVKKD
jgi:hypothetical protein